MTLKIGFTLRALLGIKPFRRYPLVQKAYDGFNAFACGLGIRGMELGYAQRVLRYLEIVHACVERPRAEQETIVRRCIARDAMEFYHYGPLSRDEKKAVNVEILALQSFDFDAMEKLEVFVKDSGLLAQAIRGIVSIEKVLRGKGSISQEILDAGKSLAEEKELTPGLASMLNELNRKMEERIKPPSAKKAAAPTV